MFSAGTRLDATAPVPVLEPLRAVNAALLELLDGFSAEDWARPTVHPDRSVKDLTAHLLQGSLFRVSTLRDGYHVAASGPVASREELTQLIQRNNRDFLAGLRRVSPRVLRELLERYDAEMLSLFAELDPQAPGLGVVWAGEWVSPNWFDVAREYTEKWHHQQQLRDATGRPPLYAPELFVPALETFSRALPHAYQQLSLTEGTSLSIALGDPAPLGWTLRRHQNAWQLFAGADSAALTTISLSPDLAWRLWTLGIPKAAARGGMQIVGDPAHAEPLLGCVAILA
jgi:uncharacterized protein (TIGR03083 family)